jgi:hypothetical protein
LDTILETLKIGGLYSPLIWFLIKSLLSLFKLKTKGKNKMSVNQTPPPPPPTARKPLKQSVQEIREGSAPQSPTNIVAVNAPAVNVVAQPSAPVTDFSKIKKISSIVPPINRVEETVVQQPQVAAPQPPTQNPAPVSPQQVSQDQGFYTPPTYYEGGSETSGYIEFDLQSYRQRGVEERFLNISLVGLLEELGVDDQDIASAAVGNVARNTMRISDRAQFDALKTFFNSLEWED